MLKKIIIFILGLIISFIITFMCMIYLSPLFNASSIIFPFAIHPFDICTKYPILWTNIKKIYFIFSILSYFFVFNHILSHLLIKININFTRKSKNKSSLAQNNLSLIIGTDCNEDIISIPEKSLYQNILITGTIGSGKTSSAMYPFTRQLISYNSKNPDEKLGMLILDVKGNYIKKVSEYCKKYNREKDLIIIDLHHNIKYNPLDKPNLKATVLANRLKTILELFSKNNSDSYWLDKVEEVIAESIKLCRLYNNYYVTFMEIHKLITDNNYYKEKIKLVRKKFLSGNFSNSENYDLLTSIKFFENEFNSLDSRTLNIIKSELTRITNTFISDYDVLNTFCPPQESLNFKGFHSVISEGKIVILNMNISEYKNLSKIIAAYMKLDFQSEVLLQLANSSKIRPTCFISDEFHEYVTASDADFLSQSRESKCINIIATQSYTSLLNTLNNPNSLKVITQNLINKIWLRNDDLNTIEDIQKQLGKEDKIKYTQSISENAKETHFNYILNRFNSRNSTISESINTQIQNDFIFDTKFFTQELETFSCLAFLSDGNKILPPKKLYLIPYFLTEN